MKHMQWICLAVLGIMMVLPACTRDSVDKVPVADKVPAVTKAPAEEKVPVKNTGSNSRNIQRSPEPITREWCIRAYYLLTGIENNYEDERNLHYKDIYECINFGEFEVMARTRSSAGTAKTKFNEKTWYWYLIASRFLKDQLKKNDEFLKVLEEAKDAGTFDGSLYNEKYITYYIENKYEDIELLKQYAKHQDDLGEMWGVSVTLIYGLYKFKKKLTYVQFRNLCLRNRYSAKMLIEKNGNPWPQDYEIFKLNEEQMEEEYGKDWRIEACTPDPDFGFIYLFGWCRRP